MNLMEDMLEYTAKKKGILHIQSGSRVFVRVDSGMQKITSDAVSDENITKWSGEILDEEEFNRLKANKFFFKAFADRNGNTFRVNFYFHLNKLGMTMKYVSKSFQENISQEYHHLLKDFANMTSGIVIISGPSGSGRSNTASYLLDQINSQEKKCILSIEHSPILSFHKDKESIVIQREIGKDTKSISNALQAAMYEDIDVLFVDEVHDAEAFRRIFELSQNGVLVFMTVRASSTKYAIHSIINEFTGEKEQYARDCLSSMLRGIIEQKIIRVKNAHSVLAIGVMRPNEQIREIIRSGDIRDISSTIVKKLKNQEPTQTLVESIVELYKKGIIDRETALRYSPDYSAAKFMIDGIKHLNA